MLYLSKETLAAPTSRGWVIDVDIVVLSGDGLLHKRFMKHFPVHFHMVLALHQVTLWCRKVKMSQ